MAKKPRSPTEITSIRHKKDTRVNIPTEELRRPFAPPETGKIAVKVINHYGDEVLKVYDVATVPHNA